VADATDGNNFGKFKVPEPVTDLAAKALREAEEAWETRHGQGSTRDLLFYVELDD
jgi:hypothetical protein